jgi:hypothetical protein
MLSSCFILIGAAACLPIAEQSEASLSNNTLYTPTMTPSATIIWFPPTPTFTPLPSATLPITPTLDTRPNYGDLILADNFSEVGIWTTGKNNTGSIAYGENELTIAVNLEKGYLFSLRQGTLLENFYAEINTSPSICREEDEYGLLIRVSPSLDFLRFSFSCNGYVRVDRILQGQASSPQPPILCGQVPPGAPSTTRMGVLAQDKDILFYANNKFLFSIRDPNLQSGTIGVFVRAAGQDPVTVNFSDLKVYESIP